MRLAVPLLALAACHGAGELAEPPAGPPVAAKLTAAHVEPLAILYRASGTVRGRSTVTITSKVAGYVRKVNVRPGDAVTAGQVLVELEANDVRAGVVRQHAELDRAMQAKAEAASGLEAARVAAELAKKNRDRDAKLAAEGAITRSMFDDSDAQARATAAQLAVAEARLRGADSSIAIARASLGEGQATLDYARVTAPFAGRIVERTIDPGALASPSTPLLVLDDGASLRVEVAVEESRAGEIKLGDPVSVEIADHELTGTVGEIVPAIDVSSRAFVVKIDLPSSAGGLQPGTFARVGFKSGTRERLVVPTGAISTIGSLDRVYVVDHGTAHLRMISKGESQGPWTEVLAGLSPGEQVADAPAHLRDGVRIEGVR